MYQHRQHVTSNYRVTSSLHRTGCWYLLIYNAAWRDTGTLKVLSLSGVQHFSNIIYVRCRFVIKEQYLCGCQPNVIFYSMVKHSTRPTYCTSQRCLPLIFNTKIDLSFFLWIWPFPLCKHSRSPTSHRTLASPPSHDPRSLFAFHVLFSERVF